MDIDALRERLLEAYQAGPEAVAAVMVALMGEMAAQQAALVARVATLEAANATLRGENAALQARLDTNSHNSSKPPSSDGPGARPHPQSQRGRSGRKPGGQPGHVGQTLRLVEMPDAVVVHTPRQCGVCGQSLEAVATSGQERRQVVDLPPLRVRVVEHQAERKRCMGCRAETTAEFPEGVTAPVQYGPGVTTLAVYLNQEQLLPFERTCAVLAEVFGCPIAEGTLERAVAACHTRLAAVEGQIKAGVTRAAVGHFDETGVNVGGKLFWLHVASTPRLTFYAPHSKRGQAALAAVAVLPAFGGRAVHDGWAPYWQYGQCAHALCNAHHLRELTFVEEQLGQGWAKDLRELLVEAKGAVEAARGCGLAALPAEAREAFAQRYDVILAVGLEANPPPEPTGKRGRPKRGKAGSLVARLQVHKEATLAFMADFAVPFDNNQAERDIRMAKVRQKISGCFRTPVGAERFCRIRGYISTLRKQGIPIFAALTQAIGGNPPMPAPA